MLKCICFVCNGNCRQVLEKSGTPPVAFCQCACGQVIPKNGSLTGIYGTAPFMSLQPCACSSAPRMEATGQMCHDSSTGPRQTSMIYKGLCELPETCQSSGALSVDRHASSHDTPVLLATEQGQIYLRQVPCLARLRYDAHSLTLQNLLETECDLVMLHLWKRHKLCIGWVAKLWVIDPLLHVCQQAGCVIHHDLSALHCVMWLQLQFLIRIASCKSQAIWDSVSHVRQAQRNDLIGQVLMHVAILAATWTGLHITHDVTLNCDWASSPLALREIHAIWALLFQH